MNRQPAFSVAEFNELVCSTLDRVPPPDLSFSVPLQTRRDNSRSTLDLFRRSNSRSQTRAERAAPNPTATPEPPRPKHARTRTNSLPKSFFDISPDAKATAAQAVHHQENTRSFFDQRQALDFARSLPHARPFQSLLAAFQTWRVTGRRLQPERTEPSSDTHQSLIRG
ncbi:hypothetical protein PUNSTDRAFT_128977 [Punctularia strigosozonata HHB-11173 SS5]|uniref:uncharacterized protein n=1 Tax=Punctularia strigosozonata (strain HHB-11173) TaxID=741275 RepID=UPI0004417CEE|nr:uncharacterized protein PUNSTDRAFT_128977 [Punctularia strigosozonata HHB-11173 SS5]EIN13289.1 hypothetical protein PUNSTDRAFT_128977 [Punctularia strigosozonata HHB-11173 SS5]